MVFSKTVRQPFHIKPILHYITSALVNSKHRSLITEFSLYLLQKSLSRTFDAAVPAGINKSDDGIIISHYTPSSLHTASINVKLELKNGILTFTLTENLFFLVNYRNFTFQILSVNYGLKKARKTYICWYKSIPFSTAMTIFLDFWNFLLQLISFVVFWAHIWSLQ